MGVSLYNKNCMEFLDTMPDESVSMVFTSPPYNVGKNYDESIDLHKFINLVSKKLKKDGVFGFQVGVRPKQGFLEFIDIETYPTFISLGFNLINRVIWHYGHGLHCKNRFSGRYETIMFYCRTKNYTFNLDSVRVPSKYPNKKHYKGPKKGQLSGNPLGKNPSDVWDIGNVKHNHPEKTEHPCQFPLELANRSIRAFTNEGDTVLDPFLGSGTTAVSCIMSNRNCIGIESNPKFLDIASKRVLDTFSKPVL